MSVMNIEMFSSFSQRTDPGQIVTLYLKWLNADS